MLTAIMSLLSGGATGLIGTLISSIFGSVKESQERKRDIELRKLDLEEKRLDIELAQKEFEFRDQEADREADVALRESADTLQAASYLHDKRSYSEGYKPSALGQFLLVLVDVFRGLVRPALTVYLIWLVWDTRAEVVAILAQAKISALSSFKAMAIYESVINMILYLAATCVTWWFGSRTNNGSSK